MTRGSTSLTIIRPAACTMSAPPYFSYFQNLFLTLVISRPNFRGLGQYTLDGLRQARTASRIGAEFDPLLAGLADSLQKFDATLGERLDPTAGDTEAFRQARTQWLAFVQEQQLKVVNAALYGKPALKDFRRLTRGKLAAMPQETLLINSGALAALYADNAAALQPLYAVHNPPVAGQPAETLAARATRLAAALRAADSARDQGDQAIDTAITTLAADWVALALALRRVKGMLEVVFDTDQEVYDFFDFSKARASTTTKKADKQAAAAATSPPAAPTPPTPA